MCVSIMTFILVLMMTTMMMAVEYVNRVPASRIISNLDGRRWKRGSGPCTTRQIWCQRYICGESMCLITVHGAQWTRYRPLGHIVLGTRHTVMVHRTGDTWYTVQKQCKHNLGTKKTQQTRYKLKEMHKTRHTVQETRHIVGVSDYQSGPCEVYGTPISTHSLEHLHFLFWFRFVKEKIWISTQSAI